MKTKITWYEILIFSNGRIEETIVCQNKRKVRKALFEYFTHAGRTYMWKVWDTLYGNIGSFEKWLKNFIRTYRMANDIQVYRMEKNHFVVVKKKEKIIKKAGK